MPEPSGVHLCQIHTGLEETNPKGRIYLYLIRSSRPPDSIVKAKSRSPMGEGYREELILVSEFFTETIHDRRAENCIHQTNQEIKYNDIYIYNNINKIF